MKELFVTPSVKREPVPAAVLEELLEDRPNVRRATPSPQRVAYRFLSR